MINPADQTRLIAQSRLITGALFQPGFTMTRCIAIALRKAMREFETQVRNWLLKLAMLMAPDMPLASQPARRARTSSPGPAPIHMSPTLSAPSPISFRSLAVSRHKKRDAQPASKGPRLNTDHLLASHLTFRIAEICKLIRAPYALIAKLARRMRLRTHAPAVPHPSSNTPYTDNDEARLIAPFAAKFSIKKHDTS